MKQKQKNVNKEKNEKNEDKHTQREREISFEEARCQFHQHFMRQNMSTPKCN